MAKPSGPSNYNYERGSQREVHVVLVEAVDCTHSLDHISKLVLAVGEPRVFRDAVAVRPPKRTRMSMFAVSTFTQRFCTD